MKTTGIIAALAAIAAAAPLDRRAIQWVTTTTEVIEYVSITTTVYVDALPTPSSSAKGGEFYNIPQVPASSSVAAAQSSSSPPVAASVAPPAASAPAPPAATTTSVYQAPVQAPPAPATSAAAAAVVAPPAQSSVYVAPAAPAATSAAPVAVQASSSNSGGTTYSGDITYYDVGMGSCGWTSTPDQAVVALAIDMMNNPANPNNNPLCGKTITISYNGATHQAKVVDTCHDCSTQSIDLSTSLFAAVAPNGDGRVHNVNWWFN